MVKKIDSRFQMDHRGVGTLLVDGEKDQITKGQDKAVASVQRGIGNGLGPGL